MLRYEATESSPCVGARCVRYICTKSREFGSAKRKAGLVCFGEAQLKIMYHKMVWYVRLGQIACSGLAA